MKAWLLLLTAICTLNTLHAQQFSFEMYFEDALGNKDTIVLGYDSSATLGIDTAFAEQDISGQAKDTAFDVRLVQYGYNAGTWDTVVTNRQIIPYGCDSAWQHVVTEIHITTDNWPVKASWDDSPFHDPCRSNGLFTSVNPGGWFDTSGPSDLDLVMLYTEDDVVFTSQVTRYGGVAVLDDHYAYLDSSLDTVSMFWFTFYYSFSTSVPPSPEFKDLIGVFPNPATDKIVLTDVEKVISVTCYTINGEEVACQLNGSEADISTLPTGVYFLHIEFDNDQRITKRFVKQ